MVHEGKVNKKLMKDRQKMLCKMSSSSATAAAYVLDKN